MICVGVDDSEIVEYIKEFLLYYGYISKSQHDVGVESSYSQNEIRILFGDIKVYYIKITDTIMYYDFACNPKHNIVNNDYEKFKKNKHRTTILKRLVV